MQIRICVARRVDDGRRPCDGEWLSLPISVNHLKNALEQICGEHANMDIVDFEAPFLLEDDGDVYLINEAAAVLTAYDNRLVYALCGCTDNLDMLLHVFQKGLYHVFQDVKSLRDVAERLLQSGCYGNIPTAIKRHIDMEKLIRDLEDKGQHMQYEVNTAGLLLLK